MRRHRLAHLAFSLFLVLMTMPAVVAAKDSTFSQAELDQILAPIALYPDALLSQMLMASTYPDQIAEAANWSKSNTNEKGDDAVKAVQDKPWDPSVASLVAFPQALAMMGDKPDWVSQMGDAFLADPEAVMETVQGLRQKAKGAGNLDSTEQQKVVVDESSSQTIIKIESADPKVVYVPTYNPTVVYGTWWWPAYPPFYWPPPPGYGFAAGVVSGIGFGVGIAITNSIWGGFDWYRHDVNIDVNRYNNININKKIDVDRNSVSWKHNAVNRKGKAYADRSSQEKFGQKLDDADKRNDFRGRDAERDKARAALKDKGIDPAAERGKLQGREGDKVRDKVRNTDQKRDLAAAKSRPERDNRTPSPNLSQSREKERLADRTGSGSNALSGINNRHGDRAAERRGGLSSRSMGGGRAGGGRLGGGRR